MFKANLAMVNFQLALPARVIPHALSRVAPTRISFSGLNSVVPSGKIVRQKTSKPQWKIQCTIGHRIRSLEAMLNEPSPYLFHFTPEDMASEERFWDMYERWIVHNEHSRSTEEKKSKFEAFKSTVKTIYAEFQRGECSFLVLNNLADMSDDEFLSIYSVPIEF